MNILVVEDDIQLNHSIVDLLKMERFSAFPARNLREATRLLCKGFAVALLDIMLPDGGGYQIIDMLRASGEETHIIMLTALSDGESKRICYEAGADDYMTKPFDMMELLYKINAVKRRIDDRAVHLRIGDLKLDRRTREMTCGLRRTVLQPSQSRLLESLAAKRQLGEPLGVEEIGFQDVGTNMYASRRARTLVARTRKSIQEVGSRKVKIVSEYGNGYHLDVRGS